MAFPKFEDWTPPWEKRGEDFDADTAAKFIYNLQRDADAEKAKRTKLEADHQTEVTKLTEERDELQGKVTEHEEAELSEVERLRKQVERLQAKPDTSSTKKDGDNLEAARLRIALNKGLTEKQAARLVGDTAEALEADADAYIEEHGLSGSGDENEPGEDPDDNGTGFYNDNAGGGEMPSNRPKVRGGLRGGFGPSGGGGSDDPSKLAEYVGRY